jgi:hypothetical protein
MPAMAPYGGFDHNAQAIRIVTMLERHYAAFDGLNLTWETLEGIAKHNGPVTPPLPAALAAYDGVEAIWSLTPMRGPRRRSPRWPTTSPITTTICWTGFMRVCSRMPIWRICR